MRTSMNGICKNLLAIACLPLFWAGGVPSLCAAAAQFYHPDHLGSVNVSTDEGGDLGGLSTYTPFGETVIARERSDRSNLPTNHLYTHQELDRESSLYDYGARYYDPALSQFVSIDLVEENPPYAYAFNNPIIFIDPDGRDPKMYSPDIYPSVLDYRAEHNGEDPPNSLIQQWQEEISLERALPVVLFGMVVKKGARPHPNQKVTDEQVQVAYRRTPNSYGVAAQLGISQHTAWRRLASLFGKGYRPRGQEPRTALGKVYEEIAEADGNFSKAARELGYKKSAISSRLGNQKMLETLRILFPPASPSAKGLEWEPILSALKEQQGNVRVVARQFEVDPATIRGWIEAHYKGGQEQFRVDFPPRHDWRWRNRDAK
ncbi:MAG: hypothetical protein HY538_00060 [Deltaproteobacteria bacterium]|nr:hypothetical protein [Deltaproteobacteria bacterium]